jgi:hypothetical protein
MNKILIICLIAAILITVFIIDFVFNQSNVKPFLDLAVKFNNTIFVNFLLLQFAKNLFELAKNFIFRDKLFIA